MPAPAPWMVTLPMRSVWRHRAFWAPMTPARGSDRGSFWGETEAETTPLVDLGVADELVAEALGLGRLDVGLGDRGDALAGDVGRLERAAEEDVGQDDDLGQGVEALDVGGRVGLGVAQLLGQGQGGAVVHALGLHLAQDEVGRPVEDALDLQDRVPGQAGFGEVEDRRAAHDRALDPELEAVLAGQLADLAVVEGGRALVRGDDVLAEPEGLLDVARRRLAGLDVGVGHLGDDAGVGALDHVQRVERFGLPGERLGVGGQVLALPEELQDGGDVDALGDEERALELVGDGHDPGLEAEGVAEVGFLVVQDLEQPLADGAAADERELVFHRCPPRVRVEKGMIAKSRSQSKFGQ
ncbi:MAG: hypothetical protein MZV63_66600 [Marinilabiliales bacterium]|nr:hypothetical protein [Marinilabiliales bacterium]